MIEDRKMSSLVCMDTSVGKIMLKLRGDVAPKTCDHFRKLIEAKLYDATTFYRSDFVIQGGLHGKDVKNPFPNLSVNEASRDNAMSNKRGTLSVGHWAVRRSTFNFSKVCEFSSHKHRFQTVETRNSLSISKTILIWTKHMVVTSYGPKFKMRLA